MVPSRSRKTAGRKDAPSARSHLRGTKPPTRREVNSLWLDPGHATVIDRAAPQKTRAAVRLFLHHCAPWSNRRRAIRIRGTKNCYHRQANRSGDMHCSGIVSDKKLATREQRRKIGDPGFADQANDRTCYSGRYGLSYLLFRTRTEK